MKHQLFILLMATLFSTNGYGQYLFHEQLNDGDTTKQTGTEGIAKSPIGPAGFNNVLIGISDFAIARSKTELNIAFFNRFHAFLDDHPEAGLLFPDTRKLLGRIEAFQYNEFLPRLRSSFFHDLNSFPDHLGGVLALPKYQALVKDHPEINVGLASLSIAGRMRGGQYPLNEIITDLASASDKVGSASTPFKNYRSIWKLMDILSKAFVDPATEEGSAYYTIEQIRSILNDDNKMQQIRKGLLDEIKKENLLFYTKVDSIDVHEWLDGLSADVYDAAIQHIAQSVSELEYSRQAMDKLFEGAASPLITMEMRRDVIVGYLDASVASIVSFSNLVNLCHSLNAAPYLEMVQNLMRITRDAVGQDYPSLASSGIVFLEQVLELTAAKTDQKNESITQKLETLSKLLKYANFAANTVAASSAEEVKAAIDAVALPPGSSSIKKHATWNVALQMHLGAAAVLSHSSDEQAPYSWKNRMAPTLPIGISINKGLGKAGSLGVFASLVDIGAIAQYRLGSDSTISEEVRLQHIFSPGISLSYGFPYNLPLSLNFGSQYGPGLTSVNIDGIIAEKPTWRWLASLTVDIPVFNLFNRNFKKTVTDNAFRQ